MSSPFFSFVEEFLRKKTLPADAPVADRVFHGMLRKQLKAFKRNVMTLIPTFENIVLASPHCSTRSILGQLGQTIGNWFQKKATMLNIIDQWIMVMLYTTCYLDAFVAIQTIAEIACFGSAFTTFLLSGPTPR